MSTALARDLAALLGPASVTTDDVDKRAYAHDLWPRQLIATRAGAARPQGPAAIVWASDTQSLASIVTFARKHSLRLAPFAAGSAVTGAISLGPDTIAVDFKRLRTIHAVDVVNGLATIDAGILGEHLEQSLGRRGATLGHFPSSISCSTLGGWIATRGAGQCSGRYGKIEDMVVSIEGVLPTGDPFVSRAPTAGGIDTRALFTGSEGRFGFITRATVRIWPAPVERRYASFTFATMREAWETIRAVYQAGLRPAVARLYDPFDTYIFKTGGRPHAPRTQSPGRKQPLTEYVLRRLLKRPAWLNQLNDVAGEAVFGRSLLLFVFEASQGEAVDAPLAHARALARAGGGRDEGEQYAQRWLGRRHAVSYRQPPMYARGAWVDTMEVAASWSKLEALYDGVREALSPAGFVMAHMSHAYPDGCSIYFTFAGGSTDDRDALATYAATWKRALQAAHDAGGTISHHHGVGRSKREALRLELGAGVDVFAQLAHAADPHGVMQPGTLVSETPETRTVTVAPPAFAIDAVSRLVTVPAAMPLADVHARLAEHALVLRAPTLGTVGGWLASREVPVVGADPVDHEIAGFTAHRPDGSVVRVLPAPRRSCGPDLTTLFTARNTAFGTLDEVTLRAYGADEPEPVYTAPVNAEAHRGDDSVLTAWLARATR